MALCALLALLCRNGRLFASDVKREVAEISASARGKQRSTVAKHKVKLKKELHRLKRLVWNARYERNNVPI
jgi:hypothetical protein